MAVTITAGIVGLFYIVEAMMQKVQVTIYSFFKTKQ